MKQNDLFRLPVNTHFECSQEFKGQLVKIKNLTQQFEVDFKKVDTKSYSLKILNSTEKEIKKLGELKISRKKTGIEFHIRIEGEVKMSVANLLSNKHYYLKDVFSFINCSDLYEKLQIEQQVQI